MNRNDYSVAIRSITDLTTDDLSEATLTLYLKNGYQQLMASQRRWPWLEASATLTTVVDERFYPIADIGADWREVISIINPTTPHTFQWIDYPAAERVWMGTRDVVGVPLYWSKWEEKIALFPKPVDVYALQVRGYRTTIDWTASDNEEADLDVRLQPVLVDFVIGEIYKLQEDVQMSQFYHAAYAEAAARITTDVMREPAAGPLVLSSGNRLVLPHGPRLGGLYWDT